MESLALSGEITSVHTRIDRQDIFAAFVVGRLPFYESGSRRPQQRGRGKKEGGLHLEAPILQFPFL